MDLDEVRRKRIKLFGPPGARQEPVASSSTPQTFDFASSNANFTSAPGHQSLHQHVGYPAAMDPPPGLPDVSEDEKLARKLQMEFEAEEQSHSNASSGLPSLAANHDLTQDEILANQLYDHFGQDPSLDGFNSGPYADIPGWSEMVTADEEMARALQDQFDNEDENDDPHAPSRSRSTTPQPTVELPPTPPSVLVAQKIDDSDDANAVQAFASHILNMECAVCNSAIQLDQVKLLSHFGNINDPSSKSDSCFLLKCSGCPAKTCPGCGERVTKAGNSYGNATKDGKHATWHCDRGRTALIWLALCGFDHVAVHNKISDGKHAASRPKPARKYGRGRFGRESGGSNGIGYGGDRYDHHSGGFDYDSDVDSMMDYLPPVPNPANKAAKQQAGHILGTGLPQQQPITPSPQALQAAFGMGAPAPSNVNTPPVPGSWPPATFPSQGSHPFVPYTGSPYPPYQPQIPSQGAQPAQLPLKSQKLPKSISPSNPPAPGPMSSLFSQAPLPPATPLPGFDPMPPALYSGPNPYRKRKAKPSMGSKADPDDAVTTRTMLLLAAILPSPDLLVPTEFDYQPPPILASILKRSSILDRAATLLHNDSLELVTQRFPLYDSVVAFIRTLIAGGAMTRSIVYESLQVNKAGHDLLKVSFGRPTRMDGEKLETRKSVAASMGNLASQSKNMLSAMQTHGHTEQDDEQQMLLLATLISECADLVAKHDAQLQLKAKLASTTQENKDEWQKPLVVVAVPDHAILEQHYYAKEAESVAGANPPRRRMARIFKELVSLQTDLPPGIFIRHGEGRPDLMKVVIIGPEGTPYAHGMFEFDLFCPVEYPSVSPKMQIRTTGGGTVGFNPNLYADGKVCLSLLGTWQGQGWSPGESTLLQVFVSIQAMIFNDEPWCNEPGRENTRGSSQSKNYNRGLYPSVVKYAMLEWIEGKRSKVNTAHRYRGQGRTIGDDYSAQTKSNNSNDIWAEVTKKHFQVNSEEIVKTVVKWTKDAPAKRKEPKAKAKDKGPSHSLFPPPGLSHPYPPGFGSYSPPYSASTHLGYGGGMYGGPAYGSSSSHGYSFTGQGRTIGGEDPVSKPQTRSEVMKKAMDKIQNTKVEEKIDTKVERLVLDDKVSLASKLKELLKSLQGNSRYGAYGGFYDYNSEEDFDGEDGA